MPTLEELEKKRAARRDAKINEPRAAQELVDLTAIDALEESTGEVFLTMTANGYAKGAPVKIAFRTPTPVQYKRYCDKVGQAQAKNDPNDRRKWQEQLASDCLVYPPEGSDELKAMLAAFPGLLISLSIEAAKAAELRSEEEGK